MSDIKIVQEVKETKCELCVSRYNSTTHLFSDGELIETWYGWTHKSGGQDFIDLDGIKVMLEALGHTVRVEEEFEHTFNRR